MNWLRNSSSSPSSDGSGGQTPPAKTLWCAIRRGSSFFNQHNWKQRRSVPLAPLLLSWRTLRYCFMLLLSEETTLRAQECQCTAALAQCANLLGVTTSYHLSNSNTACSAPLPRNRSICPMAISSVCQIPFWYTSSVIQWARERRCNQSISCFVVLLSERVQMGKLTATANNCSLGAAHVQSGSGWNYSKSKHPSASPMLRKSYLKSVSSACDISERVSHRQCQRRNQILSEWCPSS